MAGTYTPPARGSIEGLTQEVVAARVHRSNRRSRIKKSPHGPVAYTNPHHPWLTPDPKREPTDAQNGSLGRDAIVHSAPLCSPSALS